jgi:hypothetical protein
LIANGVSDGDAGAAIGGDATHFWPALCARVAFTANDIDESVWLDLPLVLKEIHAYKAAQAPAAAPAPVAVDAASLISRPAVAADHADQKPPTRFVHADLLLKDDEPEFVDSFDVAALRVDIVLFVVTRPELDAVLRQLRPLPERKAVLESVADGLTQFVGLYGVYAAVVVQQPGMGAGGVQGSFNVVGSAVRFWQPKAAFMAAAVKIFCRFCFSRSTGH